MIGTQIGITEINHLQLHQTLKVATTTLKRQQKQKQEQMKLRNTVNKNEWQRKVWADWTVNEIFGVVMLKITTLTS